MVPASPSAEASARTPFAELLVRHRMVAGLSQVELAARAGLSERAVRDLERGVRRPRRFTAQSVAAALRVSGDDLTQFMAAAAGRAAGGGVAGPALAVVPVPDPGDLVGRSEQLRRLADLVLGGRHRMVTVTGPGGVGKSRLVAELVAVLRRSSPLDVRTLDLSALAEPGLVGELIAEALGCSEGQRLAPVERVAIQLRDRRTVLVLDRFERLIPAAADVAAMVRACPGLTVLTTSQRPLRVRGERQVALEPLPTPAAVELFARRAAAVAAGFRLTPDNSDAVTAICRAVEGLPLAVELAAARMRMLTPDDLLARLDRQLRVLTGGARDAPARQRSMRATIESSLELMDVPTRTLFAWLGAFTGGAALADIEAVTGALGQTEEWLLGALSELVDTCLVRMSADEGASRYTLPDAMAELAREWLVGRTDRAAVEHAVAARYLTRVRASYAAAADRRRVLGRGDAGNVREAVLRAPAELDEPTVTALYWYFELTGRLAEGQHALAAAAHAGHPLTGVRAGQLALLRGDVREAHRLGTVALSRLGPADHALRASVNALLGTAAGERRDVAAAQGYLRASLAAARRTGSVRLIGGALNNLGSLYVLLGRWRDAERLLGAALVAKQRCRADDIEYGRSLYNLAVVALLDGRADQAARQAADASGRLSSGGHSRLAAAAAATEALALHRLGRAAQSSTATDRAYVLLGAAGTDDRQTAAIVDLLCSVVLHGNGSFGAATAALRRALSLAGEHLGRDTHSVASALAEHAVLLADRDPDTAAALQDRAERIRLGEPLDGAVLNRLCESIAG